MRWPPSTRASGRPEHEERFITTFIDLQSALAPTPGVFPQGSHDYRRDIPEAMRQALELTSTDDQMAQAQQAPRDRKLRWEVRRRAAAA